MIKLSNRDYIWSYVGVFMSLCSNLLMTPILVYFFDGEILGLWYVFQSLIAVTTLFDFGFAVSFARNINFCWSGAAQLEREGVCESKGEEPNFALMKRTIKVCKLVYLIISVAALLIMATAGTAYVLHITADIEGNRPIIAWIICVAAIFTNLYYGYYNSLLRGVGAIQQANKATVFARIVQIILMVLLLVTGCGLVGACIAYFSYGLLLRVLGKRYFYSYHEIGKKLAEIKEKPSRKEIKELFSVVWHNSSREGIINISQYLSGNACTIIASLVLSLEQTGIYSLGVQLASAVSQISMAIFTTNQPVLQSAYVAEDKEKIKRTMALSVTVFLIMNIVGMVMLIFIGLPIFKLIKPDQIPPKLLVLAICVYQLMLKIRECYATYFSASNRIIYMRSFLLTSIVCVVLSAVLLQLHIGVWGLVMAQIASLCIYDIWKWPAKAHREMKMGVVKMLRLGVHELSRLIPHKIK